MPSPLIIAHRGASAEARENTIAAFERAIVLGADLVEFDVRCTSDRVLIVYHDSEIQHQPIQRLTWAEVQAIDAEIPRFDQVLACCQGRIRLDVEIKEPGYEAAVLESLQSTFPTDKFVITSFHPDVLEQVKRQNAAVSIGFLLKPETVDWLSKDEVTQLKQKIEAIGVDYLAPSYQMLSSKILTTLLNQELPLWIWTVNTPTVMQELMLDQRVAGIITDKPELGLILRDRSSTQNS
ncbi:MAG TPA: glycerophosphodiester phosphodiesterase [Trichocoleus sp.]|jgi:glycerophosphoryl diester phosphodiesterase